MGLLSNRINRDSLKAGDHIYSWRTAYIYAHHGIYIGDGKVIHFTRRGEEVGTGTVLDIFLTISRPTRYHAPCTVCTQSQGAHGVILSCLDCFLAGGILYRFEYAVNPALFIAKARGGTCTLAVPDPKDVAVHRAKYLLEKGFRCYNVFTSNCEDFAIYCKTGRLVIERGPIGQGGQAVSIVGGPLAAVLSTPLRLITTNIYGMAVTAVGVYCASRYAADIGSGLRKDVVKMSVEDLTRSQSACFKWPNLRFYQLNRQHEQLSLRFYQLNQQHEQMSLRFYHLNQQHKQPQLASAQSLSVFELIKSAVIDFQTTSSVFMENVTSTLLCLFFPNYLTSITW